MSKFFIEDLELEYSRELSDSFSVSSRIKDYIVEISDNPVKDLIEQTYKKGNIVVIDANVYSLYFKDVKSVIDPRDTFIINAVESNKTIKTALRLIDFLSYKKFFDTFWCP